MSKLFQSLPMRHKMFRRHHSLLTLAWLGLLAGLLAACSPGERGEFGPRLASPTPGGTLTVVPIEVTFRQLNENPYFYRDQYIRVSGLYTREDAPDTPACTRRAAPRLRWALIADNLRLDVTGYEQVLLSLPEETALTLDGYWRLYEGPVACGKRPSTQLIWYLAAEHIVAPNPLPLQGGPAPLFNPAGATPAIDIRTLTPSPTVVGTPAPGGTPLVSPSPTLAFPTFTPTAGATPGTPGSPPATSLPGTPSTATATPSPAPTLPPTLTPAGSPTPTIAPGTPSPTPSPGPTATNLPVPTATPGAPPPTFTATPEGYPGATNTPTSPYP